MADDAALKEIERLDGINRDLGLHLNDELKILLDLRLKILAIERLIERTPQLKEQFEASLASVKDDESVQPNSQWLAGASRLFGRMATR